MRFVYFIITISNRYRFSMVQLFISKCLLFRSDEKIYWLLGGLGWLSFLLLAYGLYSLWSLDVGCGKEILTSSL